ncbi:MAG: ComEC/Rec2 family competence protein [bacterium]
MASRRLLVIEFCLLGFFLLFGGCAEKDLSLLSPDLIPPEIEMLAVEGIRVSWITSEPAQCVVFYGSKKGRYDHYGYNVYDGGIEHYVDLVDITPGRYYLQVLARDGSGNRSVSAETVFEVGGFQDGSYLVYTMVDVGWGDCHLLELPNGKRVLIDAGYGSLGQYEHSGDLYNLFNKRGVQRPSGIKYMVVTHNHADHYGGFLSIIPLYKPQIFFGPAGAYSSVWISLGERLSGAGIKIDSLSAGDDNFSREELAWDNENDVRVKVLASGMGTFYSSGSADDRINSDSIVLKISFGLVDILLAGDAENFVEQILLRDSCPELQCEILKIGHHGNDDATCEPFLRAVRPRVGLISNSLEENNGVFDQTVIDLLNKYNVDYYVTDRAYPNARRQDQPSNANITVTTDGESYVLWTWK